MSVKVALETTMTRLVEVYREIVQHYETRSTEYLILDNLMIDLKITPKELDIPCPKFVHEGQGVEMRKKMLDNA